MTMKETDINIINILLESIKGNLGAELKAKLALADNNNVVKLPYDFVSTLSLEQLCDFIERTATCRKGSELYGSEILDMVLEVVNQHLIIDIPKFILAYYELLKEHEVKQINDNDKEIYAAYSEALTLMKNVEDLKNGLREDSAYKEEVLKFEKTMYKKSHLQFVQTIMSVYRKEQMMQKEAKSTYQDVKITRG